MLLTEEEEYRHLVPGRSRRRNGWMIVERRLLAVIESSLIRGMEDLAALLPPGLSEQFTTEDLAVVIDRPRRRAQQMAYCLRIEPA